MPQATDELRKKFFNPPDDGISKCIEIIEFNGGSVTNGEIIYSGEDQETWDAIEYLACEWDYAIKVPVSIDALFLSKYNLELELNHINNQIRDMQSKCPHEWVMTSDNGEITQTCSVCRKKDFK